MHASKVLPYVLAWFCIAYAYEVNNHYNEYDQPLNRKFYDPSSSNTIEQTFLPSGSLSRQKLIPAPGAGKSHSDVDSDTIEQKLIPASEHADEDSDSEFDGKTPKLNNENDIVQYLHNYKLPPPHPLPPPPHKYVQEDENTKNLALALGIGIPTLILTSTGLVTAYFLYRRWKRKQRAGSIYDSTTPIVISEKNYTKPLNATPCGSSENTDLWALPRQKLEISFERKLGSGAFCNVFFGRIIGMAPMCMVNPSLINASKFRDCEVAIKMLPSFADDIARSDFQQEINFMKSLNYHPHLVSMLGYVFDPKNPLLVVEFCHMGDLLHLVRERKMEIINAYENGSALRIRDLVSFAWQISNGLEYLSSVGCIHRDIALRNVLVDDSMNCKIGDFGLCRLTDNLLYTARGGRLPLRWMAPESLRSFEYSFQSDVWSYGILLYELFTFGDVPYGAIDNSEIHHFLESGRRLEKPDYCPDDIYSIMRACWEENGTDRPSFTKLCSQLVALIEKAQPDYGYVQAVA